MFYSPLRYPGGKGRLAGFMKQIIVDNDLREGVYVEPFTGGAGIALSLLLEGYVSKIVINDLDRSIFAFWHSLVNRPEDFCKRIMSVDVSISEWHLQKQIQNQKASADLFDLGFSTFFLNRTNRSGIINGGIIGGKMQAGHWTLAARFNKDNLIRRIQKIACARENIEVHNLDAIEFININKLTWPKKSLIYYDPPYFAKGQQVYVNAYIESDHKVLCSAIRETDDYYWVLTYDNAPEILNLYSEYRPREYQLHYSAGRKRKGKELMFFGPNLQIG